MKVPFGDLKLHYRSYKQELDSAIQRVLESGQFLLGPELERFERDFEAFLNTGYVAGCASGTEAIYLALAAAGVGLGDEVITVAHTAVPTISAISMTGATPVFVDIEPDTYLMDVSLLEAKITAKTKAIVPVHLYGHMVDMESVMKIAAKHGIKVIEDVAQATGATYRGQKAGTIGDYGTFSFYPSKNLGAFGDAGCVATKQRENFDRLVMLRNYGQSKRYYHDVIGINSRLDEIQAAILGAQLPHVPEWNRRRREIAGRYTAILNNEVLTPVERADFEHVFHLYVIRSEWREELQASLLEQGVQCLIHYPVPAHLQKAYQFLGGSPGQLPVTERAAKTILSLPMHPGLTNEQVDYIASEIVNFQRSKRAVSKPQQANATLHAVQDFSPTSTGNL